MSQEIRLDKQEPAFHKPKLAGPDHAVVLYMPCDSTLDDLLHDLPQHQGQDDRLLVPQIFLSTLPVDRLHICKTAVNWDIPSEPELMVNA